MGGGTVTVQNNNGTGTCTATANVPTNCSPITLQAGASSLFTGNNLMPNSNMQSNSWGIEDMAWKSDLGDYITVPWLPAWGVPLNCPADTLNDRFNVFVVGGTPNNARLLYQTLTLKANTQYKLKVMMRYMRAGNGSVFFDVNGQKIGTSLSLSAISCDWSFFERTFSTTSTTNLISIKLENPVGASVFALDNFEILEYQNGPISTGNYTWAGPNNFASTLQNPSISQNGQSLSGVYTVKVVSESCVKSSTVSVQSPPAPQGGALNTLICQGSSITLTASTGTSYVWTGPNNYTSTLQNPVIANATTAMSGVYSLSVGGACGTSTVSVKVFQKPIITLEKAKVIAGETLSMSVNDNLNSYQWSSYPFQHILSDNKIDSLLERSAIGNVTLRPMAIGRFTYRVTSTIAPYCQESVSVLSKAMPCIMIDDKAYLDGDTLQVLQSDSPIWLNFLIGQGIMDHTATWTGAERTSDYAYALLDASVVSAGRSLQVSNPFGQNKVGITIIVIGKSTNCNNFLLTGPSQVNQGDVITLNTQGCLGTVTWTGGSTGTSLNITASNSSNYTAFCRKKIGLAGNVWLTECQKSINITVTTDIVLPPRIDDICGACQISVSASLSTIYKPIGAKNSVTEYTGNNFIANALPFAFGRAISNTIQDTWLRATGCAGTVTWTNTSTNKSFNDTELFVLPNETTVYKATCTLQDGSVCSKSTTVTVKNYTQCAKGKVTITATGNPNVSLSATGCPANNVLTWFNTKNIGTRLGTSPNITVSLSDQSATFLAECMATDTSDVCQSNIINIDNFCNSFTAKLSDDRTQLLASGCTGGTVTWSNNLGTGLIKTVPNPTKSGIYTATCSIGPCKKEVNYVACQDFKIEAKLLDCDRLQLLTTGGCQNVIWYKVELVANGEQVIQKIKNNSLILQTSDRDKRYIYQSECEGIQDCKTRKYIDRAFKVTPNKTTVNYGETVRLDASGCTVTYYGNDAGQIKWQNGNSSNSLDGTSSLSTPPLTQDYTYTATCKYPSGLECPVTGTIKVNSCPDFVASVAKNEIPRGVRTMLFATGCTGTIKWYNVSKGNTIVPLTDGKAIINPSVTTTYQATCQIAGRSLCTSPQITVTVVEPPANIINYEMCSFYGTLVIYNNYNATLGIGSLYDMGSMTSNQVPAGKIIVLGTKNCGNNGSVRIYDITNGYNTVPLAQSEWVYTVGSVERRFLAVCSNETDYCEAFIVGPKINGSSSPSEPGGTGDVICNTRFADFVVYEQGQATNTNPSVTLIAEGCTDRKTITWSNSSSKNPSIKFIRPSANTTYTVRCEDSRGYWCEQTISVWGKDAPSPNGRIAAPETDCTVPTQVAMSRYLEHLLGYILNSTTLFNDETGALSKVKIREVLPIIVEVLSTQYSYDFGVAIDYDGLAISLFNGRNSAITIVANGLTKGVSSTILREQDYNMSVISQYPTVVEKIKLRLSFTPYFIAQSHHRKGMNEEGTGQNHDMMSCDMTDQQIIDLNSLAEIELRSTSTVETLTNNWKFMSAPMSIGELYDVNLQMIDKFVEGTGGSFSHATLTKKAREDESTTTFLKRIKDEFSKRLAGNSDFVFQKKSFGNTDPLLKMIGVIPSKIRDDIPSPSWKDMTNGLGIMINDTWGYDIKITKFSINKANKTYSATFEIEIFDHYGLDRLDIDFNEKPVFAALSGFRSWFVLQHSKKFCKKPFYTIVNLTETINGAY